MGVTMKKYCTRGECERQDLLATISVMVEAIEQVLDDMTGGGLSVCEDTKKMLVVAYERATR